MIGMFVKSPRLEVSDIYKFIIIYIMNYESIFEWFTRFFYVSGNSPQAHAMCLGDPAKAAPKLGAASSGF